MSEALDVALPATVAEMHYGRLKIGTWTDARLIQIQILP